MCKYTFKREKRADGSLTRWSAVIKLLRDNGAMTKAQILSVIYPARERSDKDRGYCSELFGQMRKAGIINYNKHSRVWSVN